MMAKYMERRNSVQIKNRWYSVLWHRLSDIRVDPTMYLGLKEQLRAGGTGLRPLSV
jgi:hypothetical protein